MSNKYFSNWEKTQNSSYGLSSSAKADKADKADKAELEHLKILRCADNDDKKLNRILDKMKTEEKAKKIFNQTNKIHTDIRFFNSGFSYPQPVHIGYVVNKYIIVNGSLVLYQND